MTAYQKALGSRFMMLPEALRALHGPPGGAIARGELEVVGGRSWFARLCQPLLPTPPDGVYPTELRITENATDERWERRFSNDLMLSRQYADGERLIEAFGFARFAFHLCIEEGVLRYHFIRQYLWRLPLPRFLSPRPYAEEQALDATSWRMSVSLSFLGCVLFRYSGVMRLCTDSAPQKNILIPAPNEERH